MTSLKLAESKETVSGEASGESPCGCRRCKVYKTESLRQKDRAEIFSYRCGFFRAAGFIPAAFSYSKSGGKKCSNFRTLYSEQYKQSILT